MLSVTDDLQIREGEIEARVSTSSGPGGQNVNRVRTRVTLRFNVLTSPSLREDQRETIIRNLGSRLDGRGFLRVTSQRHRTQGQNREEALGRLCRLLAGALEEPAPRKKTRKPRAAAERRLEEKRQRSRLKQGRAHASSEDD